jgi:hypothetical protein
LIHDESIDLEEMQENKFKQAIRDSTDKTLKTSIDNNEKENLR